MATFLNKTDWDELIAKFRVNFPQLTEEDLEYNEGNEAKKLRMVEYKLGKTKAEMQDLIAGYKRL